MYVIYSYCYNHNRSFDLKVNFCFIYLFFFVPSCSDNWQRWTLLAGLTICSHSNKINTMCIAMKENLKERLTTLGDNSLNYTFNFTDFGFSQSGEFILVFAHALIIQFYFYSGWICPSHVHVHNKWPASKLPENESVLWNITHTHTHQIYIGNKNEQWWPDHKWIALN